MGIRFYYFRRTSYECLMGEAMELYRSSEKILSRSSISQSVPALRPPCRTPGPGFKSISRPSMYAAGLQLHSILVSLFGDYLPRLKHSFKSQAAL